MYYSNSGYIGCSMSVRASNAYSNGLLTLSKIKASNLKENKIEISLKFLKWLIKQNVIDANEWHHTGKHFNETDFYDLDDIKEQLDLLDLVDLKEQYDNDKCCDVAERGYYAFGEFEEWVGSRKRGHFESYNYYAFIYKGWAYISASSKKSIEGRHFEILKTFKIKPREMNTKVRDEIFKKLRLKGNKGKRKTDGIRLQ